MASHCLNDAKHHTIMGDEVNHEMFYNPNINIHNNTNDTDFSLRGITLMGLSTDSHPFENTNLDDNDVLLPADKSGSITLMGSCSDLTCYTNKDKRDIKTHRNGITLMGNTHQQIQFISKDKKAIKKKVKHKKISSESYWRMFVYQQPQIFIQILSFLLPFEKIQTSNITKFMNEFIVQSQLKYMIQYNEYMDDEKLDELKTIKLKTNWQKYDVIDYDIDRMIWNNDYDVCLNYKSLVLDIRTMDNNNIWNSKYIKQLKYFLMNQTKLSKIYHCIERNKIEDNMYQSNSYQDESPLSQILHNITHLYCKDNGDKFGINGTVFCSDLLSSSYCKIQSLYLNNNGLNDDCMDMFCHRLLGSNQMISCVVHLDLSDNMDITGECVEVLFTLIGEKCNRLNSINLSGTSMDDRVCHAIYDYYRCYYGSASCNLQCVELMNNKWITMEGVVTLNKVFDDEYGAIIANVEDKKQFKLLDCQQLQDVEPPNNLDYRIIIRPQCE